MTFSLKIDPSTRQEYMAVRQRGRPLLINPCTNKSTAFTAGERNELDLWGLLPPAICTMEQQLQRTYENFQANPTDLEKFIYLTSLHDRNETLFFRLVLEHIDEMMPIVYTPICRFALKNEPPNAGARSFIADTRASCNSSEKRKRAKRAVAPI